MLLQICDEEFTHNGIRVKWGKTVPANNVESYPPCYNNEKLITRNCVGSEWKPPATELSPCLQILNYYNLSACPPGFDQISKCNQAYCYQIKKPSAWNYPCLKSGGASVITDLTKCPPKYHSVRYMPDEGICLGIEESRTNLTFQGFIASKMCNTSLGDKIDDLKRFIFKKIAKMNNLPQDTWFNPQGDEVHVFSLTINVYYCLDAIEGNGERLVSELCSNLTDIFKAKKVILMAYLNNSSNYLTLLLHMHIAVDMIYEDNARNIQRIYNATLNIAETELPKYNYILLSLASSMYCLPTISMDKSIKLNWDLTPIGHIAAPKQFCLQENGLPVKRLCNGTYMTGSFWGNVEGKCNHNYQPSNTTTFLYKFVTGQVPENCTSRFLTDGLGFVLRDVDIIIPADIYYLSMSLQHILSIAQGNLTSIDMGNIANIAWVMDRIMVLNNNYLRLAQTLNSTNVILDSLNNIIEILAHKDGKIGNYYQCSNQNFDYQLAIEPQFILQVSYPSINNVSGLAVIKSLTNNDFFVDLEIRPLYKNTSLEEVMSIENLEIATWIPDAVLSSLKKNENESDYEKSVDESNMHVIISVFHNDAIFQELEKNTYYVNSRIIGISLPGFLTNFIRPIPLIYRGLNPSSSEKFCGFWNFQPHSVGNVPGYWSNSGCSLKKTEKGLTVCECDHLTHFGQLFNIGRNKNRTDSVADKHTKSLNIISLVGSFLSLLGIMGIWITASVFHIWRKKASTKVLLHLSTSIALPLIFMTVFNLDNTLFVEVNNIFIVSKELRTVCISLGALLHYSVLASFMWMLITAVLQFIRYVRVLGVYRPSRFMIKFTLVGWGTPIVPVMIVLALDRENYIPNVSFGSNSSICYPSGFYLIISVVVPICIILAVNITLFVLVIYAISKGPDGKIRRADIDLIGAQLRLSIFLFFLLGLTWIFGVLSFSSNPLWSYLFCLTSTMQGFVLFVYFIICDAQTRNLWITLMKPQFQPESSRKSISIISNN
nr:uncharacterized protein LOC117989400 [Maniola hyperantus]